MNLKNDSLRKRFDGMKYDIKKMEEVVYDISLRGLVNKTSGASTAASSSSEKDQAAPAGATETSMGTEDADMPSAKRVSDP